MKNINKKNYSVLNENKRKSTTTVNNHLKKDNNNKFYKGLPICCSVRKNKYKINNTSFILFKNFWIRFTPVN